MSPIKVKVLQTYVDTVGNLHIVYVEQREDGTYGRQWATTLKPVKPAPAHKSYPY